MPIPGFRPRAAILGSPIHAVLVHFPIACFVGALFSDLAYLNAPHPQWANFSEWLLAFGELTGVIAAVFGAIDLFGNRRADRPRIAYLHFISAATVLVLGLFNNLVHARDGWTGVAGAGITLSVLTVLALVVTGLLGHRLAFVYQERGRP